MLRAPVVILSPTSGAVGTSVTITGTNFGSYRGDNLFVHFDNEEIASFVLETDSFSTELGIPHNVTVGGHWISIKSAAGSALANSLFTVQKSEINLDALEGAVGTTVTVAGTGYCAGRMVTIYFYNRTGQKLGTEFADAIGKFSYGTLEYQGGNLGPEQYYVVSGDLIYKMNRNIWLKGSLQRYWLESNVIGGNTNSTMLMVGVRVQN